MICKDNMRKHDMTKLSNFLSEMRGDILRDIDMRTCDNPYRLSANKVIEIVNGAFDVAISVAKRMECELILVKMANKNCEQCRNRGLDHYVDNCGYVYNLCGGCEYDHMRYESMKLSDFLRMMCDDILCDIEFCTTVEQIVDTVKGSFDDAISAAEENRIRIG